MAILSLSVPQSDRHTQVKLTMKAGEWFSTASLDESHRLFEFELPPSVSLDDVEVTGQFCGADGEPDPNSEPMLLKPATPKPVKVEPKPVAKVEPKPEPKPEVKIESKPEPKTEVVAEKPAVLAPASVSEVKPVASQPPKPLS